MTAPERDDGTVSASGSPAPQDGHAPELDPPAVFVRSTPEAPAPRDPPKRPREAPEWLGMAGVVAIVLFLGAGARLAFDLERAGSVAFWGYAIGPTVLVAVVALIRAARDGEIAELVRPEWGDATRGILSAAALLLAAVAFSHVVTPAGSPRESWMARIYLQLGDPGWLRAHTGMVAATVLVAAAAEEIVWRGLVTRLIAERFGSRFAWAWAAGPYALALSPTVWTLEDPVAGKNPLLMVAALALGLVWGGMARYNRRLAPSILSHAAFDWCVIVLFRLWGSSV